MKQNPRYEFENLQERLKPEEVFKVEFKNERVRNFLSAVFYASAIKLVVQLFWHLFLNEANCFQMTNEKQLFSSRFPV